MRLLAASLMWTGSTVPAAWLYAQRMREPAAVLMFMGAILTLWVMAQKGN